ncbi:MAG: NAD(P)/FAD-dependent oxidoreductase [bacterium]
MEFKYVIIGAGVVGLAVARELSLHVQDDEGVVVLEKEKTSGTGISSRNSEVIHAGIYYPTNSLKHRLCIEGRRLLYQYCAEKNIPHQKCGKLIIATDPSESDALAKVYDQAQKNGVENVVRLTREEALALEPDINVHEALLSKETGIINVHSLMDVLEKEFVANNGTIAHNSEVVVIAYDGKMFTVTLKDGTVLLADKVINCAGLGGIKVSELLGITPEKMYPCKGSYFSYNGKHSCKHLVYPVPEHNLKGLGVHATISLDGTLRFGPDVEYSSDINDYQVDSAKHQAFALSAQKLFNNLDSVKLTPDMAGMRPKIQGPSDKVVKDFYIKNETEFPGFINLLGIESPGLTASLAIGQHVWEKLLV